MYLAIGPPEIGLILLGIVILFGAKKLPGLARAMGSSVTQFKKGLKDDAANPQELEGGDGSDGAGASNGDSDEGSA
ncbi:MAG: twin-arginine translocase TatA/TatE family subunit [Deltaproteobacteria bacterium]|jgi:sec-independent protein translocase protein TatA|nr:twin-arginine translocase TatA/TatE family subunit [Deltaproteobacteria bacterium]